MDNSLHRLCTKTPLNRIRKNAARTSCASRWLILLTATRRIPWGGSPANVISNGFVGGFIGGGGSAVYPNRVGADFASVLGGIGNNASGFGSTAMGDETTASGTLSTAMGHRARANHDGSFVWADYQFADFASTAINQFSIRAQNGLRLSDGTRLFLGGDLGQKINLYNTTFGIGIQSGVQYCRVGAGGGFAWYAGGVHYDNTYNAGAGLTLMKLDTGGLTVNGTFVSGSDRNTKENFAPVDPRAVLAKVAALPLSQWNYKADVGTRHLGPMAQDFYAAFGIGPDDKHIATVDADGVALAAIQGLNQKLEEKDAELQALKQTVAELKAAFDQLDKGKSSKALAR